MQHWNISAGTNLRKRTWLLTCCYNPHKSLISSQLNNILDKWSKSHQNVIFMGDFNVTMDDKFIIDLYELMTNLLEKL